MDDVLQGDAPPDASYRQRIRDSEQVLYEFTYYGAAYTGDYAGMTILDSTEKLTRGKIDLLPSGHFCAPPSGKELCMTSISYRRTTEQDTIRAPIKAYAEDIRGTRFRVTEFAQTYGSATFDTGLMRYEFDDLSEGTDSLTLNGVSKIHGGHEMTGTVTFEKGNVWVDDFADHRIRSILIECVINKRGRIYKPTSPFEIVPDRPIVGVVTYEFFPRDTIYSTSISDFGIWKPVRW